MFLLAWNIFNTFFWCFYLWLWTSKCLLGCLIIIQLKMRPKNVVLNKTSAPHLDLSFEQFFHSAGKSKVKAKNICNRTHSHYWTATSNPIWWKFDQYRINYFCKECFHVNSLNFDFATRTKWETFYTFEIISKWYAILREIWYLSYNLKNVKNIHNSAWNFAKSNTPPGVFFTFLKKL